jgi:hypothetical protein
MVNDQLDKILINKISDLCRVPSNHIGEEF